MTLKIERKVLLSRITSFFAIIIIVSFSFSAKAQTTSKGQIVLTWQARSFYPADYLLKAPATTYASVSVSAELLQNNKLADLSNANFFWYLDENLFSQGVGLKEITFKITKLDGDSHFIRVRIKTASGDLESAISIPITQAEAVIDAPYPQNTVKAGSEFSLQAIPYFFSVNSIKDLIFSWEVNSEVAQGGNDNQLTIKLGTPNYADQRNLSINSSIFNNKNPLELAKTRKSLTIY